MGRWDEDPFLREGPVVPAPEGPVQRHLKAGVYGATLGFMPGQFKPEGVTETIAEIAGSIPTYAAASALGAGPAAAAIRATTGLRAGYAVGSAAVAAGLGATTEGARAAISGEENPFIAAAKGAAIQGGLEYAGLKGLAKFTKSGRAAAAIEKAELSGAVEGAVKGAKLPTGASATAKANELVKASAETPLPEVIDTALTRVPDVPTIRTLPAEGGASFPTTPREFTASYGPRIDAESHVSGLPVIETDPVIIEKARKLFKAGEDVNIARVQVHMGLDTEKARAVVNALKTGLSQGRVQLDHFVDNAPATWAPSMIPSRGPSDIGVRLDLERRFTPEIIRSAETMTEQEFTKYAIQDPVAREVIKSGKSDPQSLWAITDVYKDRPQGGMFSPTGKNPQFTETFDETLGKKVLVPLNEGAGGWVDALKASPSPRHLELQLGVDQLKYFESPQGIKVLKDMDVVAKNEPFMTSNLLKQPDEVIERILNETDPIRVIQPSIVQRTAAAKTLAGVKQDVMVGARMTEQQIDEIFALAERDVDMQLAALRPGPKGVTQKTMGELTMKEKALRDAILKRC